MNIRQITSNLIQCPPIQIRNCLARSTPELPPIDVDLFYDGEVSDNIGDGLSSSNLSAGTHATWTPSWDFTGAGLANMKIASSAAGLLRSVKVAGNTYNTNGIKGFSYPSNINQCNCAVSLPSGKDILSIGFWFTFGGDGGNFDTIDHVGFYKLTGGYFIAQTFSDKIRAHGDNGGGSVVGDDITLVPGTRYWITMKHIAAGLCSLQVYNTSGVLIGSSSVTISSSGPCTGLQFGRIDNHTVSATNTTNIIDNIIVDFTNAQFPLGV